VQTAGGLAAVGGLPAAGPAAVGKGLTAAVPAAVGKWLTAAGLAAVGKGKTAVRPAGRQAADVDSAVEWDNRVAAAHGHPVGPPL
jgi:hypothetical protein